MTARGWPSRAPRLRLRGKKAAAARPDILRLEARVLPAVFTVNSFTDGVDANPGDGVARTSDGRTTLRAAVMEANALTGTHSIILPAGSYTLSISGPGEDSAATGDLDIRKPISVTGAGAATTTIHGDGTDRIFDIFASGNFSINALTLTGGRASLGGALRMSSDANLTLADDIFLDNQSTGDGGAIGAIGQTGLITVRSGFFQNNRAGGSGGAISLDGLTLFLSGSTLANNTAEAGGGALNLVDTQGSGLAGAQIRVSTFSSNTAAGGGAAFVGLGTLARFTDTTITLNNAAIGGGVQGHGTFGFGNSIVAGNFATQSSPDVFGATTSQGFNIIGDGSGASGFIASDKVGTAASPIDPRLSALHLHGGAYPVHVPLPGSPALNQGSAFDINDQRGFVRPSGTGSDIGSVEAQAFGITTTSNGQHAPAGGEFGPIQVVVTENGQGLAGAIVNFVAPSSGPSGSFAEAGSSVQVATDGTGTAFAPTFTANFTSGTFNLRADAGGNTFVDIGLTIDAALLGSLRLTGIPASTTAGQAITFTVTAFTSGGAIDTNYTGTVTISNTDPAGSAPQVYTFQQTDAGQKTFTVTLNTVGNWQIRVTDPNLPQATANVNVTPVPLGSLQLTGIPASTMAGQAITFTVTAFTSGGAIDTNYTGTVTISNTDPAGSAPQVYTFQQSDNGQKSFTVTLNTVGNWQIRVTDPNLPQATANVSVTPVTNQFEITAPETVNEGEPFSITITVRDSQGNILTNYTGPITFTSNDPRAVLPTGAFFSSSDQGVKTFSGFSLRPLGPRFIRAEAGDGTSGQVSIGVVNFGPSALALTTSAPAIFEGQSAALNGTFTNPDPQDTHTVVINWGDGSANTILQLGAGVFQFQSSHTYTDDPAGPNDQYPITVLVTDAAGGSTNGASGVTVTNVAPQLDPTLGIVIGNQGTPLGQPITFTDPGNDVWTAIVNFGDATGAQTIQVGPNRTFTLNHVYTTEGTFRITIQLMDDDGGQSTPLLERSVIFLPGTTGVKLAIIPAGASGTLNVGGATVTLNNLGGTGPAFLLLGIIDTNALNNFDGSPTKDSSQLVASYDIRVLDAGPLSSLTASLRYPEGQDGADPVVQFLDKVSGKFVKVQGSASTGNSFSVDKTNRVVTFTLKGDSIPTVAGLDGTVFTLSVPAPAAAPSSPSPSQSANTGSSPFQLINASAPALVSLGGDAKAPAGTTGLVGNNTLTVALSAAEGLRRGGGDESLARRFVNSQTLSTAIEAAIEIKDFLVETFRMWLDDPPPMEAPVLPAPEVMDQVQLREISVNMAAEAAHVDAAPPLPAGYQDVPLLQAANATDPLIAPAESHPWWLKAYEHRPESDQQQPDPIPLAPSSEPSDADRAAALLGAVWLGGHALAVSAPEREDEEEEKPPRYEPTEESED